MQGRTRYEFSGVNAIVTGSTKGIGRGIAAGLADAGANVVVNARTESDVEETAAELEDDHEGRVVGIPADMSDPDAVERLVTEATDAFGTIDLLVNNAAVWPREESMQDADLADWDHGLGVNARGAYYASALVARAMIDADVEGSIVNVTSQAGEPRGAGHGLYGVSKSALNGVTWRMAHDLAEHGIRVNAVSTTMTDSYQLRTNWVEGKEPEELTQEEIERAKAERDERVPIGRLGEPEDIADGVLFLASDAADYVTGHILRVSGGKNLE
jgi:NAD(P)-dependent dehydrogenase (short-subunit alcohol dehydrogenase family)